MHKIKTKKRWKSPKKTTRVTVDIPSIKHKKIKAFASLKGETLQQFILTCVDEKMVGSGSKSKLEALDQLGLLGTIEESEVTSTNYKEHIRKSIKKKHDKYNH